MTSILKKYWWLIALAIAVLILKLFPEKLPFLEKIDSGHPVISSGVLSRQSSTSIPAITFPEILWNKDITPSGNYLLSTLVDRKAKTFGWTQSTWKSPPLFAEFRISRSDTNRWGVRYTFAAGNLHKDVLYIQIAENKVTYFNIVGNKPEENPCDPPGQYCITRLQVIDNNTIAILLNSKEEYTYYRIDGMMQVGIRGHYNYRPDAGMPEFQNRFTPCNAKVALDTAQLAGSESLMTSLTNQALQYSARMNKQYWDLAWPLYVEGNAVFEDSNRVSDRYYRFAKINTVEETSPADCGGGPMARRLGDFLFPASDPLGSSPFRRATQAEIDVLRKQADWPSTLEHCGADHPSSVFRAYDLSGDGQVDFVFSSPCGGEDPWNHIWVHHGDSLRYVGAAEGRIRYFFDRRPGTFSVLINRGWCCASFSGAAEAFRFDATTFKLTRTASVLEVGGIALSTEEMPPTTFIIAKEGAMLREDPHVDDKPFADDGPWDHPGNIIASVKRGAKGKAVGRDKGKNGDTWLFVVLDPAAELSADYISMDEKGTSISGWMNMMDLTMQ
jgi:hypothetical protein